MRTFRRAFRKDSFYGSFMKTEWAIGCESKEDAIEYLKQRMSMNFSNDFLEMPQEDYLAMRPKQLHPVFKTEAEGYFIGAKDGN